MFSSPTFTLGRLRARRAGKSNRKFVLDCVTWVAVIGFVIAAQITTYHAAFDMLDTMCSTAPVIQQ